MALSANAAKTLEQVKMGLLKLYGADYFTEDEFIKIDCLIHKGKYFFTNGPPKHAYDEELMSFEEFPEEMKPIIVQTNSIQSFQPSKKDIIIVSEEQDPSPGSSEVADSPFHTEETPNATSAEASSDEEIAPPISLPADSAPMFDFSEADATFTKPSEPEPQPWTSNGLPLGITQQQLDEARAMQAAMTKAGQKRRPQYSRFEEPKSETAWAEDLPLDVTQVEEAYPSSAPSERDTRISVWASDVDAQATQQRSSPQAPMIAFPLPKKLTADPTPLIEKFVKEHGRNPKALNDIYQPNNPTHFSNRSVSVISASNSKTSKVAPITKATKTKIASKNGLELESTYVAQSSQFKSSHVLIDIKAGDHIKVKKFVSGIQWVGINLRTGLFGQFSEEILKVPTATKGYQPPKPAETASVAPSVSSSGIRNGLENVEGHNAAEWDEVPATSRHKSAASAPVRPALGGGLGSSRFAVLAEGEEPHTQTLSKKQEITPEMEKEFGKLVSEKVDEILKARGMAPTPTPAATSIPALAGPSRRAPNEPMKPVPPKENTCWFWATGKGCRFTAEECRDLHGHLPSTPGSNLYLGKPTWGAAADSAPVVNHADPRLFTVPTVPEGAADNGFGSGEARNSKTMTCWYWARDGNCNYTAESCKYLHEHSLKGVAPRPWQKLPSWEAHTWVRKEDGNETVVGNGEGVVGAPGWGEEGGNVGGLVLEEVDADDSVSIAGWGVIGDGGAGGWGRDTPLPNANEWGGGDRYKPPHVKALEEKARIEAVGW